MKETTLLRGAAPRGTDPLHAALSRVHTCPRCGLEFLGAVFDPGDDPALAEFAGACFACAPAPAAWDEAEEGVDAR